MYDISKEPGLHESTVSRYSRRLFSSRTVNTGGRPTVVSKVTKRLIKRKVMEWVLKASKEVYRELVGFGYDTSYQSEINGFDGDNHYRKRPSDLFQHHDLDFVIQHEASKLMSWCCITSEGPEYAC
ncbi:hypothetical protein RO3G_07975 [Rhizopus delemar RA 99-880]|uniref:Uncharacterized protein n=1 Tax=Rhizopus delemar (strain RA 99-880 / ATCC MYA-4621 / FGSC 9543 / NRRL 43880) TaxID=246409 RepID=I1C490_RHIO9|nr:hypothetical protein RO3G_07975 [Rhizopus delemar RA 99-880]|eukprot:EIE83270.1 hypothetical protein RO3G_07975 [Rhizopus delemar RA 99-880]